MDETLYMMALSCLRGISRSKLLQLYRHWGSAAAVCERTRKELAPEWAEALKRASEEMEFCLRKDIRVLTPDSPDYPVRLKECEDGPPVLFFHGNSSLNTRHVISVVGTRRISEYGKDICQDFINNISDLLTDILIVSGLAYGVDIHAHRACTKKDLPTVGVLAHGLDRIYPSTHRDTAAEMVRNGGLVTEYMRNTNPDKGNFVRRNRIIAGMCDATVIVESAEKGGALITARLAQDYNRDVFAFPGRIGDEYSTGCNNLIRQNGAALITSAEDLVEAMGWNSRHRKTQTAQRELFPELTETEQRLCELLRGSDGTQINVLVAQMQLPVSQISAALFELELKGMIKAISGNRFRLLS